ncbi:MAG: DUF4331 domain-containing protein, partial [Actinomycetota bacterium]
MDYRIPAMRIRGVLAAGLAAVLALSVAAGTLRPGVSDASSHREAPLVAADPQIDATDLYAFVSPDAPDTVTIVSNWIPFQEPAGGPNFYAWATGTNYDVHIDNNGDAKADITYRWKFKNNYRTKDTFLYNTGQVTSLDDPDLNFRQTYDLRRITRSGSTLLVDDAIAAPSFVGDASMPDYAALAADAIEIRGSLKTVAGQSDDPFFLDLRVFDLLYGADLSEVGDDTLAGFNVSHLALQVPKSDIARRGDADANPIVGVWTTASRRAKTIQVDGKIRRRGEVVQVSRLGMPLVNEVVIPLKDKDRFNASQPTDDVQFLDYVTDPEVPKLVEAIYGIPAPATPRNDLVAVFLTGVEGLNQPAGVTPSEQLRLNMSIPPCEPGSCESYSSLGVIGGDNAGFPNGRRLADDVIDIALQVVEGVLVGQDTGLSDGA